MNVLVDRFTVIVEPVQDPVFVSPIQILSRACNFPVPSLPRIILYAHARECRAGGIDT
jgi:hypothetical protein